MYQPDELKRTTPALWSTGTGTDVWELFCACIAGDLETVQRLIARDPTLVRCHYRYRKPLYFAVRENRLQVAAYLLERDPNPTGLDYHGTLLETARDRGYTDMERLLEARLDKASPRGEPVAAAIRERNLAKVRRLLAQDPGLLHAGDTRSNQPIHWAVMTRQLDLIDELLALGADIEAPRQDRARPIHLFQGDYHFRAWTMDLPAAPAAVLAHLRARGAYCDLNTAAHSGDLPRVRDLLGQDPTLANRVSDYSGYYLGAGSPLRNAAAGGHLEIVQLLLDRGADPSLPEEGIAPHGHALYSAVYHRHHEIARLLLESGAYPNPEVESSADALSIAIRNDDQPMIDLLSSFGAARSVELLGYYGDLQTAAAVFAANPALADDPQALTYAAENGHEGFVRLMLRYQPDLASRIGCGAESRDLTELLFARGMDPSHRDWLGATPLHQFAKEGNTALADLFIAHGAELDARDDDLRSTPLGWAARFGRVDMVDLLLEHGAKPNLPDDPPWATPTAWATRREHGVIVQRLKRWGGS